MARSPHPCPIWTDPTEARLNAGFERIEDLLDSSHDLRAINRCRCCGGLWLYEFHEEIDWRDGCDPSYRTWVPVPDREAALRLHAACPTGSLEADRMIRLDRPKGAPVRLMRVDRSAGGQG